MNNTNAIGTPVPSRNLAAALAHVADGHKLYVTGTTRPLVITADTIARFAKVGRTLLREDGTGFRMASGRKSSIYLFAGQLVFGN